MPRKPKPHKLSTSPPPIAESPIEESGAIKKNSPFLIVGIGASAGGLEAFTQMLRALPVDTGMAFILVQHLDPTHASMLTEILSRATSMPVTEVTNQMAVERNHVYVIPPGANMIISGNLLQLSPRRELRGHHRSIDYFFRSLAEEQGDKAIGVILSGTASDGTLGLQAIKAEGGITFAQDDSAQQNSMPRSAVAAGCVDFVLPPGEIAKEIVRIGRHPYATPLTEAKPEPAGEANLVRILELLRDTTGVDFKHYKHNTLYRRVTRRMVLQKKEGLRDYVRLLERNAGERQALYQDILISVTSFFRNPEAFDFLKTTVFPKLLQERSRHDVVRIWVMGCSTGEEAYSVAMALAEYRETTGRTIAPQIFATDLNGAGVEKARAGLYPKEITQDVSPERLRRFFVQVDSNYQVAKPIRDMCIFARHNVLTDPPFSRIDLLCCRNLLIYLEPVLQQQLLPILHYALRPNGFLWLGTSETIGSYRDLFEVQDAKHKFYSNRSAPMHVRMEFPFSPRGARESRHLADRSRETIGGGAESQKEADRILLAKYVPPGVLVTADMEVVQFRGDTGAYLAPAPGKPSLNVLKMLREGLLVAVRAAILKAKKNEISIREEGLRVKSNGSYRDVNVEVIPVRSSAGAPPPSFLILFEEPATARSSVFLAEQAATSDKVQSDLTAASADEFQVSEREITRLREELAATREYLQSVIEQQEAANEELQSANEEVQSSNEELQSINEELETSKEEIQSSNEELATLNEELQHRNFELSLSNNDLNNLFSSVQMAIVMLGADLRIRRFTPLAEKMLNLIPSDIGRPISDIQLNLAVPELDALLAEVIDTGSVKEQEVQGKEGRWYLLRIRPYQTLENKIDGAVIVLVDVDALKQNQEKLRRQQELLDQAYEPIFVWEFDGAITYWNKGAEETYGFTKEQAIGRVSQGLLHTSPSADVFKRALESDRRWTGELTHTRHDGTQVVVDSLMVLVRDPDGKQLVIETNHPITERKEREQILRRRTQELAEADRNRNEFLAMLAHELRNPLAPLRMAAEVLRSPQADSEATTRAQDIILRQIRNITRMVEDLLDVSRVTQRKIRLRKERVELAAILNQAAELYRTETEDRAQTLLLTLPAHPIYVDADSTRLEQIFTNLLSNASKYTARGGHIELVVELETPAEDHENTATGDTLSLRAPASQVVVRVRDDGVGLAPEALPHVFDLFMQSSRSLDRSQGGLGIGLTLVKELVDLHGGTVEAHSDGLGQGSEFVVRLPALSGRTPDIVREGPLKEAAVPESVSRRVLVVDDNEDEAKGLAMVLQLAGHEAQIVCDGPAALEMAAAFQPEVVLLDIGLPEMDGYEVASRLRQRPGMGKTLLVAVTGYGQDDDRRRAREAGFDYHFTKPIEPKVLRELISTKQSRTV